MIDFESVFLDTSPFIYLIENNPRFGLAVKSYIAEKVSREASFITSVITVSEFQVNPKRVNNSKPIRDFQNMIDELQFKIFDITLDVAEIASTLRAKYDSLRSLDSLQIAVCMKYNCKTFLTNDLRLKPVKEIKVIARNDLL